MTVSRKISLSEILMINESRNRSFSIENGRLIFISFSWQIKLHYYIFRYAASSLRVLKDLNVILSKIIVKHTTILLGLQTRPSPQPGPTRSEKRY